MSVRRTNWCWSVSLEHTLFLDFLKLFVNMRLTVSFTGRKKTHFLDLRIKSYVCLKFQGEVWAGRASAGRRSTLVPVGLFQKKISFFYFKKKNFWKFGKWARAFERMGVHHPHYLKLAPTLGSANSFKIHGEWRFHFFSRKKIPKFRTHLDLHIYRWDFCFMKK
jgi:hypothetical protein